MRLVGYALGFVKTWTPSAPSTATQNPALGHERPTMASEPCGATSVSVHEDDPAAGSCDTNTESEAPPTMQKARLAQETLSSIIEPRVS